MIFFTLNNSSNHIILFKVYLIVNLWTAEPPYNKLPSFAQTTVFCTNTICLAKEYKT